MAVKKTANSEETKTETLFSKNQLLSSEKFSGRTDILNALLSADKEYTVKSAEQMIEKFMKGKVK